MTAEALNLLFTYGPLGVIAVVFFTGYFDDKKTSKEFDTKRMEHEKQLAVIMSDATKVIQNNHDLVKDTRSIHDDMDQTLVEINQSLVRMSSEMARCNDANSTVKTDLQHIIAMLDGLIRGNK